LKTRVLDSWPILEWIKGREPVSEKMSKLLADAQDDRVKLLISAINIGEVYYLLRKSGLYELADYWRGSCSTLPATIEVPTLDDIWDAALLKGQYPIAYADAFAAALACKYNCALVTGDPEFRQVKELELDWVG
jgi:predicted nucleic acid-binding protein